MTYRRKLAPAIRASIGLHVLAPVAWAASPGMLPWLVGGLVLDHAVLAGAGMWPRSRLLGPNLTRLPAAAIRRGEVALTFDDGPDPDVTPWVLDLLDRQGATASFFCIGRAARRHPRLVGEIVRRGHSVENHSDSHPNGFACLGAAGLRREIGRAQASLAELAGVAPRFFRAPMGLRSPLFDPVLAGTELRLVSWTRRALDGVRCTPKAALGRLTRGLAAGDILLMHDGRGARTRQGAPVLMEILPGLLQAIGDADLRAVSLPSAGV